MKKIVIIFFILIIVSCIYIFNNMELALLNTTITEKNIYTLSQKVNESNLNDEIKTKIIMNLIIKNTNCYGKKLKHLM